MLCNKVTTIVPNNTLKYQEKFVFTHIYSPDIFVFNVNVFFFCFCLLESVDFIINISCLLTLEYYLSVSTTEYISIIIHKGIKVKKNKVTRTVTLKSKNSHERSSPYVHLLPHILSQ